MVTRSCPRQRPYLIWDLYNGVTEYVDRHKQSLSAWNSSMYGDGAKFKQKAFDAILETV